MVLMEFAQILCFHITAKFVRMEMRFDCVFVCKKGKHNSQSDSKSVNATDHSVSPSGLGCGLMLLEGTSVSSQLMLWS